MKTLVEQASVGSSPRAHRRQKIVLAPVRERTPRGKTRRRGLFGQRERMQPALEPLAMADATRADLDQVLTVLRGRARMDITADGCVIDDLGGKEFRRCSHKDDEPSEGAGSPRTGFLVDGGNRAEIGDDRPDVRVAHDLQRMRRHE